MGLRKERSVLFYEREWKMRKTWLKFLFYIAKKIYHFNNKIIYFCEVYVYKTRKKGDYLPELGEK